MMKTSSSLQSRINAELKGTGDLDRAILRAVGTIREYVMDDDKTAAMAAHSADSALMADITRFRAGDALAWERATNGGEEPLLRA